MIIGFDHTSFTVADIGKSVEFWTRHLGFAAASVSPREGDWQEKVTGVPGAELLIAHLYGHGHHMEFIQYTGGARPSPGLEPSMAGAAHVCLMVDDIKATWRDLLAAGARGQGEVSDVTMGHAKGCKAAYLRDPNGIIIELVEMPAKPAKLG
jgi:catechol 2,3-dioxygenase-like lactoylglutathione lyase family enzyme